MNEISILLVLSVIIFGSPYIAKIFRIPISPTEIMLGILAGSLGLLPSSDLFKLVANVGFYYLMFLAGTEVDLKVFITTDRKILKKSLAFLGILYLLSVIFVFWAGLGNIMIIIIPVMSVGLLSTLYKEYGKDEEWLNTAMLVGVIGEVISIALLTIGGAYLKNGFSLDLILHIGALGAFLLISTIIFKGVEILFWWYPHIKAVIMPKYDKNEQDIRFAMGIFCFVIGVMVLLDLEIVIGAFIAGTFIPTFFDHKKELPHKLSSFGFGFLVPIFFAYIGSTLDIRYIFMPGVIPIMLLVVGTMMIFRLMASAVFISEFGTKNSAVFALSLSMPLTLVIATATIGYNSGNITKEYYYALILASLFEAIASMVLIRVIYNFKNFKI